MKTVIILCLLIFGVVGDVSAQRRTDDKRWKELGPHSDLIVVGVIDENINSVIRPEFYKAEKDPSESNTIQLPDPKKYLVGRIYQVNVTKYLKSPPKENDSAEKIVFLSQAFFPGMGIRCW